MKNGPPRATLPFKPLVEKRTFEEISDQIRRLIRSKTLKPGDKLPSEKELAAQFKVGRLSVREALRTLEQAGLIFIRQGSTGGSYVNSLDHSVAAQSITDLIWQGDINLRDLTEARLAVERIILEKAFERISEKELAGLQKCVLELEKLVAESLEEDYAPDPHLTSFHLKLAELTGNQIYPLLLHLMINVTRRVIEPPRVSIDRLRMHAVSHREIYEGLKRRDLSQALTAMEGHMTEVKGWIGRVLDKEREGGRG